MNKKHDIILNCIIIARIVETLVNYNKLLSWQFAQKHRMSKRLRTTIVIFYALSIL